MKTVTTTINHNEKLDIIFKRFSKLHSEEMPIIPKLPQNSIYAITNFKGGIGKTTLSFNLLHYFDKYYQTLAVDLCPQTNFTDLLLGDMYNETKNINIYDSLQSRLLGPDWEATIDKKGPLAKRIIDTNEFFQGSFDSNNLRDNHSYVIPGSSKLHLFPNYLYNKLNVLSGSLNVTKNSQESRMISSTLFSLKNVINENMTNLKLSKCIIDTSPFFAGATHLAWCAADTLIIPIRVDKKSVQGLEDVLQMLHNDNSEFNIWRMKAGIESKPKIQAILVTHCGWNTAQNYKPDNASQTFISTALSYAEEYKDLFTTSNVEDHFALLNEFHGSGKISGELSIPINEMKKNKFYSIKGKRIEANDSVNKYKKQLEFASKLILGS
ncbi:ParA family protein [Clostridium sp. C8-1-8]|uniref:ParA family protein n=1 Tax=Clostridium sp. C8-1-8 TaxID=2698831 RepID=UPI00136E0A39|nr:ParA family protein [Clostridium sp. C8-1-8]